MPARGPAARPGRILVVGSCNADLTVRAPHLPRPGETVLGGEFAVSPGGKGANQAVAAARLGAQVTFICRTGEDEFGRAATANFAGAGIDTSCMHSDAAHATGVALITVAANSGENCIVVAPGANAELRPADLCTPAAQAAFDAADFVLLQLEIPLETVEFAAAEAHRRGKRVILNPAPAPAGKGALAASGGAPAAPGRALPPSLLRRVFLITPNESEAEAISGRKVHDFDSAAHAARALAELGAANAVITLGARGALVYAGGRAQAVPAARAAAVDATAAGDVFTAAAAVALAEGASLLDAARFASRAAAISVTRRGAQASAPQRAEVGEICAEGP